MRCFHFAQPVLLAALFVLTHGVNTQAEEYNFKPFLTSYCVKCHGAVEQEGELRLDTLSTKFADPLVASKWGEVLNAINGHEMPPEDERQPKTGEAADFARWLETSLAAAEIAKRSTTVVLRRMNRAEYNNTIRDLIGVDNNPAGAFPEDPPAGGFDNIAAALTMSPLQLELYYKAAREILDHALVEGEQPSAIKWRFDPEENNKGTDRYRVRRGDNNVLVNHGESKVEGAFTRIHHSAWNTGVGFRDFRVPHEGEYIIRIRAASHIPSRQELVESAAVMLKKRRDDAVAKNPAGARWSDEQLQRDLKHFKTEPMYNYGPPRLKLGINLGGTPIDITEFDVAAPLDKPQTYEVRAYFTKDKAGVKIANAYSVPKVLENFWMQGRREFARPELLIDWIELEGPIYPQWPPQTHTNILFESPKKDTDEKAYAAQVIKRFMARAYRRPLQPGEADAKIALYEKLRPQKPSFVEAIKPPLAAILSSPHFLYLVEPAAGEQASRELNDFELASRLSYFLWSSMPDLPLLKVALNGKLRDPDVLKAQVTRMLADEKSEAFVKNFAGQWLGLRKVGANPPVETLYPAYDRHLEVSMVKETEAFFAEILHNNLDARQLIKSDFLTLNERMARFYGIDGVRGDEFRRVTAPAGSHRGGVVTQASIHCITSNGTRTSPVTRGVWVMKTLLGTDPGLPVANVGEIPGKVPGINKATVRERLEIHRQNASCARCHNKIDPLGFALENFNACGQWRDREGHGYNGRIGSNDPLIDASAKMPDGSEFNGVEGLQQQLLKNEDLFLQSLASQMSTYALGRELGFSDRPAIRQHVDAMKKNKYTLRSLLEAIVTSPQFTKR